MAKKQKLLVEGGSGGHMFHPFNLPSVSTGEDLIEFFYKAAEFVSRPTEGVTPSDSTSLKVDGANTAFKLVRGPSGLEFAFDRGSMFPIDIEGITIDKLVDPDGTKTNGRWPAGHGMVAMGKIQLGALNRSIPKVKNELIALGLMDKKGNPNPTKFINCEFCWKETNAVKYEEDFIALHGVNQYYEKDFRGVHRPGAVRPLERDEKSGQMKPIKATSTEVPYDEQAMENFKKKLAPFFRDAVGEKNPDGFSVYTVIPVSPKSGEDILSRINSKLEEELTLQFREPNLSEWNSEESSGSATMSLKNWLMDDRCRNPRSHFIKMKDGSKKGAMSKEIYGRVLNGEPVESLVADPESWDVAMAVNGAIFYYAIENIGATILEALTSPLGDMVTDDGAHEGIVLRNEELFGVKMVKITGNFITAGASGNFAKARSPIERSEEPEQGGLEQVDDTQVEGIKNIALVPGAFKPPHKGHLMMVKRLSQVKVIDKVLIIVSAPVQNARALPSGQVITAEHSKLIWEQYIAGSGIDNAEVIISPAASPVQVVYDYVMKPVDETNTLIAPENGTIYMGCGDKDDDSKRFDDIIKKAREDLQIKIVTCPLDLKHGQQYVDLLNMSEDIKKGMPSVVSSKDPRDFHASDMRYLAELATKNVAALNLFSDFVPPGDALAVMGILGLNAIDPRSESDQVEEPSLDQAEEEQEQLSEIISSIASEVVLEDFQSNMKKRLSKAHAFYLDQGRQDLVKYTGGYRHRSKQNKSNAFLAKEEIGVYDSAGQIWDKDAEDKPEELQELSAVAGVSGGKMEVAANHKAPASKKKKTNKKAKNEEETMTELEEKRLRHYVKKSLQNFFKLKEKQHRETIKSLMQEHKLRTELRNIILESATEDPTTDLHDSTGINTLKDLLKNTNVLSTLRDVYKTLTTDENQKRSFRAHIIKWVQDTLAPVTLNDTEMGANVSEDIDPDVGVDILGVDSDKFIDADDGSSKDKPQEESEENSMRAIEGEDATGRNKAERVYPTIEKSIIEYYAELDNPEDMELFYDYLIANLKLYFDKWESESSKNVEEPTNDEYEQAKQTAV